jgi:hypothetical protein
MAKAEVTSRAGIESRRTPRRVFTRPIGILCDGEFQLGEALQLSEGGLLFRSAEYVYSTGFSVVITLNMPDGQGVVATGEIIYQLKAPTGPQYGIRFSELDLQQRRAIRNYVSAKTQAEAEAEAQDVEAEERARKA